MNAKTNPATPAAAAAPVAYVLTEGHAKMVKAQAVALSAADKTFEGIISAVSTGIAKIMGTAPTFDHWQAVQAAFVADYTAAHGCKDESARKRWVAVASAMEAAFALEKPAKPTKAAEVKAEQRKGAALEAAKIIEAAKATTPAEVMKLAGKATKPGVIAALAKQAGDLSKDAAKEATEAARTESKVLREEIRGLLANLDVRALRSIRNMAAKLAGVPDAEPVPADAADETTAS